MILWDRLPEKVGGFFVLCAGEIVRKYAKNNKNTRKKTKIRKKNAYIKKLLYLCTRFRKQNNN